MRAIRFISILILLFLGGFTAIAFAAGATVSPDASWTDLVTPVIDAFKGGDYPFAAALTLVLLVAIAKRYGGTRFPWLASGKGNALLILIGSFAGAMATALAGEGTLTSGAAWTAFSIAIAAAGGYSLIKTLIVEPLQESAWYKTKAPAWAKSIIGVAVWVFNKPSPVANAEAEGQKAVDEKPATGAGKPTEIE